MGDGAWVRDDGIKNDGRRERKLIALRTAGVVIGNQPLWIEAPQGRGGSTG